MDYPVPDFGVDHDIISTQKSSSNAEKDLDIEWNPPSFDDVPKVDAEFKLMQVRSDPICNSFGCTQYLHPTKDSHPVDYPVPDFGMDHDIISTQNSSSNAEKSLDREWNPPSFNDVPKVDAEFKLMQQRSDNFLQLDKSDALDLQITTNLNLKAKSKANMRKEFKQMRTNMMKNWGKPTEV